MQRAVREMTRIRLTLPSGAQEIVRLDAGVVVYAPDGMGWLMWARWVDVRGQLADDGTIVEEEA